MTGQFIGVPGGGLQAGGSWAKASAGAQQAGLKAEIQTGEVLHPLILRGPTVLNDLRIPIPGFSANVDQVIVHGSRVLVIDAKSWAPGFYWTLAGRTRRGWRRAEHCDKKTVPMAVEALDRYLSKRGIAAKFDRPMLVVWQKQRTSFAFYRPQGNPRVLLGHRLATFVKFAIRSTPADPRIVQALAELTD